MLVHFSSKNKTKINKVVKSFGKVEDFSEFRSQILDILLDCFTEDEIISCVCYRSYVLNRLRLDNLEVKNASRS